MNRTYYFIATYKKDKMGSIKTIQELSLPEVINEIIDTEKSGLIMVNGQTGVGKTTTVASMVDRVNNTRDSRIVMIQDPIEFEPENNLANITQIELDSGSDFALMIEKAMHLRADIIVIGELRDRKSIEAALYAASTGHLVIASTYPPNALRSIECLLDMYPAKDHQRIRDVLGDNLRATIHQGLVRVDNDTARLPIVEILRQTDAIREAIKDPSKTALIPQLIQESKGLGMQTMDDDLERLVNSGKMSVEEREYFVKNLR